MPAPTLEDVKTHLVIEHSDDDAMLPALIAAAKGHLEDYLRRNLDEDYPADWPAPITVACTMLTGVLYRDREGGDGGIPELIKGIVADYRVYS